MYVFPNNTLILPFHRERDAREMEFMKAISGAEEQRALFAAREVRINIKRILTTLEPEAILSYPHSYFL